MKTLQSQFLPYCDNQYLSKGDNAENCIDVAKNFAIGFAEWLNENNYFDALILDKSISKQLLEIYIKEKGL